MGQEATVLEHHIQQERAQLAESVNRLERRVSRAADWRYQYARHPTSALGIAFATGVFLAGIGASRRGGEPTTRAGSGERIGRRHESDSGSMFDELLIGLQAAVVGVVSNELREYLRHRFDYGRQQ